MEYKYLESNEILDNTKDGVIIVDKSFRIAYANKKAYSIIDTKESLINTPINEVFRIYDYYTKKKDTDIIEKVFESGKPRGLKKESALLTFKDNLLFISASISPIIDKDITGVAIFFKNISKLKKTELELFKFRKAFENSVESVIITDKNWNVEYCNKRSRDKYKKRTSEFKSDFWDITNYVLRGDKRNQIYKTLENSNFWIGEIENSIKPKKWSNVSIVVLKDMIGNVINYVISEVDITFEKESKKLLLHERKNLSKIINSAPIGMMTIKKNLDVLQINEEANSILGSTLKSNESLETISQSNEDIFAVIDMIKKVSNTRRSFRDFEFNINRTQGEHVRKLWIKASAVPIEISGADCVLISFEDETIKKEMESTLLNNERQLRLVTDNMQDTITQIGLDLNIEYCSNSYVAMLGYEIELLMHKPLKNIIHPDDYEILKRMLNRCEETEDSLKLEIRFINSEKKHIWVELVIKYVKEDLRSTFLLFGRDVTQRRITEQEMISSRELAISANNAKSEFLANMSHEIRTPLNGIIGMSNISLMNEKDPSQKDNITLIKHSAESLLKIINSVLDFSKIEAGKLQIDEHSFSLRENLTRQMKTFKIQADQKEITFKFEMDEKISEHLIGDETRLIQIMTNLVGNAIKFTEYGEVSVFIELESNQVDSELIRIRVKDTGIGIKYEERDKVFKSFSQADGKITRKFGGSGLGLNITKKLLELMNGTISFESVYGKGSEFTCLIPFMTSDQSLENTDKDEIIQAETIGIGKNVLLVEDDKINQKLATRLLKRKGYGVTLVGNGQEAVNIFEDNKFDMILMDIQMPIMDGITATDLIRKKSSIHIPIIALTAYAIKGDKENFLKKGMDDYISKPIDLDEFYRVLKKYTLVDKKDEVESNTIDRILKKIDVYKTFSDDDEKIIIENNIEKINIQLEYIASYIKKINYEKLEERCYAFKNYITSIKLPHLRKLIFNLELHIRKENEKMIKESYDEIIKYINGNSKFKLKGVELT